MIYIDQVPNPSGAYPAPKNQPFPGCIPLTDDQAATFRQYNGFVVLSKGPDGETVVTPNTEAWEAWKSTLPAKTTTKATTEEQIAELYEAIDMLLSGKTE
ncbi:hypothetical protein [uncultured Flavonifractor sp.]|uniref:hypothetical protein n=1 Tax=uncultured Flavonifractor sp. TaxID=1193534 RepID=UPI002630C4E7|nr:hypothetical protein [uncultured Flavonifractor sp.]